MEQTAVKADGSSGGLQAVAPPVAIASTSAATHPVHPKDPYKVVIGYGFVKRVPATETKNPDGSIKLEEAVIPPGEEDVKGRGFEHPQKISNCI